MIRAIDGDLPDLWISAVARAAWLLGDAEGDDVARVVGSVETFGAHYARVVERAVSITIIERGQNGICKASVERASG